MPPRPVLAAATAALLAAPSAAFAEGMPQLDFGNPMVLSQVVWLALIFLALYLLLANWGLPRVTEVIEARASTIAADLNAAHHAKAQADAAAAELAATTWRAQNEAMAAVNAAAEHAKAEAAAQARAANERLEAQLKTAEERIGQARAAGLSALRQVASDTATLVIGRLTGTAPDQGAVTAAVGTALAARGQA